MGGGGGRYLVASFNDSKKAFYSFFSYFAALEYEPSNNPCAKTYEFVYIGVIQRSLWTYVTYISLSMIDIIYRENFNDILYVLLFTTSIGAA